VTGYDRLPPVTSSMALAVSKIARMNPAIFQRARSTLSTLTAPVLTRYVGVDSDGTRRLFDEVGATQGLRARIEAAFGQD
jgi:hypothetical protein